MFILSGNDADYSGVKQQTVSNTMIIEMLPMEIKTFQINIQPNEAWGFLLGGFNPSVLWREV